MCSADAAVALLANKVLVFKLRGELILLFSATNDSIIFLFSFDHKKYYIQLDLSGFSQINKPAQISHSVLWKY